VSRTGFIPNYKAVIAAVAPALQQTGSQPGKQESKNRDVQMPLTGLFGVQF